MPPHRKNKNTAVERVADKFGNFAEFARLIGVHPSVPGNWNRRHGSIPHQYHARVLALAKRKRIKVRPQDLVNV